MIQIGPYTIKQEPLNWVVEFETEVTRIGRDKDGNVIDNRGKTKAEVLGNYNTLEQALKKVSKHATEQGVVKTVAEATDLADALHTIQANLCGSLIEQYKK